MKKKHLLWMVLRWTFTMSLILSIVAVVKVYRAKHSFTSAQKAGFNVVMLALTLLLGLNFFVRIDKLYSRDTPHRELSTNTTSGGFQRISEYLDTQHIKISCYHGREATGQGL